MAELMPWSVVAECMNKAYPKNNPPYTDDTCQKIFGRAMRKLMRLAANALQFFDRMWANLEESQPTLPIANIIVANRHKHFALVGFDPTYSSTEADFAEVNFIETADRAAALHLEEEEPEPGPTLPTEYVKALDRSVRYWRKKLTQPIVEEHA